MAKRKNTSEEESSASESESLDTTSKPLPKKTKSAQNSTGNEGESKKLPTVKKPKPPGSDAPNEGSSSSKVNTNSNGEKYIDLGKNKRATVGAFKGNIFVDLREYYGADGDKKPGKKGLSLTLEQWNTLKGGVDTIDRLFEEQKEK
ncbi:transcriptional Coactivator p15-domain-containing protein [Hygrophoropsis aurantiaca]|uniref:Transcriptional Coactivator p15-domain-containing protein n=1 Tax=Hygrophoropsis aurantiaca TaxID=72124 RepID=A0ACB8A7U6_9AGAM|nr:transcriptional Coactivator p15-domain-containing protein [Hygrophoropsis aurantiaca]